MKLALEEAREALASGEIPIGAVVVNEAGSVISKAHNQTEMLSDVTAHAEMVALTMASADGGKYLQSCTLFVTVEPCIMCAGALGWAQMGGVVYGAEDAKRGYSRFSPSPFHPKCKVVGGVLADECSALMVDFFKSKR